MYYASLEIVLQEVPGEISICFTISGCNIRCQGCHSPYLWKEGYGTLLTTHVFEETLKKYQGLASCVLFMGGEWHKQKLIHYLKYAKKQGFKTCLYTGEDSIDSDLLSQLTWVKTGKWIAHLGGLNSPTTNQQFKHIKSNNILNHLFL